MGFGCELPTTLEEKKTAAATIFRIQSCSRASKMTHFRAAAATVVCVCLIGRSKCQLPQCHIMQIGEPASAAALCLLLFRQIKNQKSLLSRMHFNGSQFYAVSFNGLAHSTYDAAICMTEWETTVLFYGNPFFSMQLSVLCQRLNFGCFAYRSILRVERKTAARLISIAVHHIRAHTHTDTLTLIEWTLSREPLIMRVVWAHQ